MSTFKYPKYDFSEYSNSKCQNPCLPAGRQMSNQWQMPKCQKSFWSFELWISFELWALTFVICSTDSALRLLPGRGAWRSSFRGLKITPNIFPATSIESYRSIFSPPSLFARLGCHKWCKQRENPSFPFSSHSSSWDSSIILSWAP